MPIIKLDATGSTNDFLRDLLTGTSLEDFTVVWADYQHIGKGQRHRSWESEKGKNLIVSILKLHKQVSVKDQFFINRAVSLAIVKTLSDMNIPELSVKWPNDILSGGRKLCGILIENAIKGNLLRHSIIGIGLNVNQKHFKNLPNAISLAQISGETYNRDILLDHLISALKVQFSITEKEGIASQKQQYEACLYKKGYTVSFEHATGIFEAIVKGVTDTGELLLVLDNGQTERHTMGNIRWITE